jgi:FG-GAP-like repeat
VVALVGVFLACCSAGSASTAVLAPAPASPFDVGGPSGQVLLADVTEDGDLDLLTRHQQGRVIRIHEGDGGGRFETARTAISLDFAPADMRLGDVNGDRHLDLVVTAGARDLVDVLLGTGTAVFKRAKGAPFAASTRVYRYNKRSLHLVDIDGDGDLDVVTENRRGQFAFRVLLGNGTGRFRPGPVLRLEPVTEGYVLAFGDVDGDRHVDVVTAVSSPRAGRLAVHLGDGRGTFGRASRSSLPLPATYDIEAVADLNSDRRPDLVLSHRTALVSVLLNRGHGRFAAAAGSPFDVSERLFAVVPGDVDRDGRLDLVGAAGNSVSLLFGEGPAFRRARQSSVPAGPGAYDVAIGDVNGDERPDVVASSFESRSVTLLLGR